MAETNSANSGFNLLDQSVNMLARARLAQLADPDQSPEKKAEHRHAQIAIKNAMQDFTHDYFEQAKQSGIPMSEAYASFLEHLDNIKEQTVNDINTTPPQNIAQISNDAYSEISHVVIDVTKDCKWEAAQAIGRMAKEDIDDHTNDFTAQEDQVKKLTQQLTGDEKHQDNDFYSKLTKKEARIARHNVKKEMDKIKRLQKEATRIVENAQATVEEKQEAQANIDEYVAQVEELAKKYDGLTKRIDELKKDVLKDILDTANKIKENALDSMAAGGDKASKMVSDGIDTVTAFPGAVASTTTELKNQTAAAISVAADTLDDTVNKAKVQGIRPFKGLAEKGRSINRALQIRQRGTLMKDLNLALKVEAFLDKVNEYKINQANRREAKRADRAEVSNSLRGIFGLKPKEARQPKAPAEQKKGIFRRFVENCIAKDKAAIMETYDKQIESLQNTIDSRQQTIDKAKDINYTRLEDQLKEVNQQVKDHQQDVKDERKMVYDMLYNSGGSGGTPSEAEVNRDNDGHEDPGEPGENGGSKDQVDISFDELDRYIELLQNNRTHQLVDPKALSPEIAREYGLYQAQAMDFIYNQIKECSEQMTQAGFSESEARDIITDHINNIDSAQTARNILARTYNGNKVTHEQAVGVVINTLNDCNKIMNDALDQQKNRNDLAH